MQATTCATTGRPQRIGCPLIPPLCEVERPQSQLENLSPTLWMLIETHVCERINTQPHRYLALLKDKVGDAAMQAASSENVLNFD
jgi:hypothetical protein